MNITGKMERIPSETLILPLPILIAKAQSGLVRYQEMAGVRNTPSRMARVMPSGHQGNAEHAVCCWIFLRAERGRSGADNITNPSLPGATLHPPGR